jgi:hypothetical protein
MIFYDKVFTDEELESVSNLLESDEWLIGSPGYNGDRDVLKEGVLNFGNVLRLSIIMEKYAASIDPIQVQYLSKFTNGKILYDAKIARYNVGDKFDWHCDELSRESLERVVSSITYLNDDFEGGETEFTDRVIKPKKNYTLIFPSNWTFLHRGLPVIKGVKNIMVVHCFGQMNRSLINT